MKRHCSGYRDQQDLMFRHTDVKSKERHRVSGMKDSKQPPAAASSQSSHDHYQMPARDESHFLLNGSGRTLLPSKENLASCFFYQTTLEPLVDADHAQYLHLHLPSLFSQSVEDSALRLATQAISLAVWAKSRPSDIHARRLSRIRYSQSLTAMKAAIQDPVEVKSDETLYAVLLLSGYEVRLLSSQFRFDQC